MNKQALMEAARPVARSAGATVKVAVRSARTYTKQFLVRVPDPTYRLEGLEGDDRKAEEILTAFREDGIVVLPGYFSNPLLESMQAGFENVFTEDTSSATKQTLLNEGVMHIDRSFLEASLDDTLLKVIAGYYRRRFFLTRADAMRLLPTTPERYGSFQWHHDTRGRQVKIMVLLNDLDERGQCMRYVKGSHGRYYTHDRMYGQGSRFEDDFAANPVSDYETVKVFGPAGTAAIFDTNGLHCGNRNDVGKRDTLTYCYTTGRVVLKVRYRREHVETLAPAKQAIVTANPHHELI